MSETALQCPNCINSIYFIGEDHIHLSWLSAKMVVLKKYAYCTGCNKTISADTVLSVLSTDLIYHAGEAYTTREFTRQFRLVIKSKTEVSIQGTEHGSKPYDLNLKQITTLTQQFRIKISGESTNEADEHQSPEGGINVEGTVSGNVVKGDNNKVTSTFKIHGITITIIGNNISVEPV